jgi:aspartate carbamoyltransferase catalytic subunit
MIYSASTSLEKKLKEDPPDVIYMIREQKERREYNWMEDPTITGMPYPHLGEQELAYVKEDAIIMHPLPRCEELAVTLDKDPRCAIWRQIRNGMYLRMGLLYNLFRIS